MNTQVSLPTLLESWALPTAGQIREIATRDGIDAATTALYRSIRHSPEHGPFMRQIDKIAARISPRRWSAEATLVIVPGAFYIENPRTGADGHILREQAEQLGCSTATIPIASRGALLENARIICDWLVQHREQSVVLASLSKGGADLKMALAQPDAGRAFRNVAAWINLCGILDGTPMAEWLLSNNLAALVNRLYYHVRGQSIEFLRDLQYGPSRPLHFPLDLPQHIQLITLVGFPLRHHLSNGLARRCHQRLASLGPNDASIILADLCALPGFLYPIWGSDHYLRPEARVRLLVCSVLQYLNEELRWHTPAHSQK